ncbi:MAG: hypothetical protein KDB01_17345 [Planctomycetaceae bacterium]|nr:hypothetical protein [Planctomycetaceae bacterium]
MLREYAETLAARLEAEKPAKPLKDKEDKLAAEIRYALMDANQTTAKRGDFRATLEEAAGRVSWKDAFAELRDVATAAGLSVEEPVADPAFRLSVVPC